MLTEPIQRGLLALALIAVLVATFQVYRPGLDGDFLLDDVPALQNLRIKNGLEDAARYVLSGTAGRLGRPVSLASFLLDDNSWPSTAYRFKRTNVLIHLLNGALLAWLGLLLARVATRRELLSQAMAVVIAAVWMLHPFNVSTTLYVVQRMAQLSTLFMAAGLLAYTHGRMVSVRRPAHGYAWMAAGAGLGGVLAVLSKENGLLILTYILVIEYFVLRGAGLPAPRYWSIWAGVFVWLPLLAFAAWIFQTIPSIEAGFGRRPFNLTERLLTETRVLFDYLAHILIPIRHGTGVFHDDFVISRSLFDPATSWAALLGVVGLAGLAAATRRRYPVVGFAIAWFLVSHLIESTVFPLEIYFEHRNYLAIFGIYFAIVYYVLTVTGNLKLVVRYGFALFFCVIVFTTWQTAALWGKPLLSAVTWADEHPASYRAQQNAAATWLRAGNFTQAEKFLTRGSRVSPNTASPDLQLMLLRCLQDGPIDTHDYRALVDKLTRVDYDTAAVPTIEFILEQQQQRRCETLTLAQNLEFVQTLKANPAYHRRRRGFANLHAVEAKIYNTIKDHRRAAEALTQAYRYNPIMSYALLESQLWAALGEWDHSKAALRRAQRATTRYTLARISVESGVLKRWERRLNQLLVDNGIDQQQ